MGYVKGNFGLARLSRVSAATQELGSRLEREDCYAVRSLSTRPRCCAFVRTAGDTRASRAISIRFHPDAISVAMCSAVSLPARRGYTKTFLLHASRRDFTKRDRLVLELLQPYLQQIDETGAGRRRVTVDVPLTPRECEILAWVERGKTNAEIAQILWISPGTVRKHLENAYAKLGVRTRTAAVARVRGG